MDIALHVALDNSENHNLLLYFSHEFLKVDFMLGDACAFKTLKTEIFSREIASPKGILTAQSLPLPDPERIPPCSDELSGKPRTTEQGLGLSCKRRQGQRRMN